MKDNGTMLQVPGTASSELEQILAVRKFTGDNACYTGIADASQRKAAETILNNMISDIGSGIADHATEDFVLRHFKIALSELDRIGVSDTEDREAACEYLEQVMEAVGLESSYGLLNTWLYGFDISEP